ncbi:MAG: hypothetical protein Q8P18_07055 [Pseudomonadota bacterium]|nr:hypothetical protein [Pseudomonadota bacterium]
MGYLEGVAPRWIAGGLLVLLLVAAEVAARLGRRRTPPASPELRRLIDTVQAAVLALLGLLLAFTFSMAAERYETRRVLVLREANAIGTAWLRAGGLPDPTAGEERARLRAYVDVRLAFYAAGEDQERLDAALWSAEDLQAALWSTAMEEARRAPQAIPLGLLLASLNEVIDLHEERVTAMQAHVPGEILIMLMFVALIGIGSVGYSYGLAGHRHHAASAVLGLLVAGIVHVILGLDEPRAGLIAVSQQSMMDLRDTLDRLDRR